MPVFFLSAAVFSLQILLSPVVTTILAGLGVQLVLAAPIIAFAVATLILALIPRQTRTGRQWLMPSGILATLMSIPLCFAILGQIQNRLDKGVFAQAVFSADKFLTQLQNPIAVHFYLPIIAAISIPYLFYGLFFAAMVAGTSAEKVPRLIAMELAGAAVGWLTGVAALEAGGFAGALLLTEAFAAAAALSWPIRSPLMRRCARVLVVATVCFVALFHGAFEPWRDLNLVVLDFKAQKAVRQLRQSWTTYAKIQTLEVQDKGESYKVIAMGGGGGLAGLYPYDPKGRPPIVATTEFAKAFRPQKALIIFAGAGRELMALYAQGVSDLTGVELNPGVIRHAMQDSPTHLAEFLRASKAKLLEGDARVFLETTPETYDLILYSWSGATVGHYSGAVMRTTQYEFTEEALGRAWERLRPNGVLLVMGGCNKINLLASLRKIADPFDWSNSVALLSPPRPSDWKAGWDDFALIVKKGKISASEIESLNGNHRLGATGGQLPGLPAANFSLVLAPGKPAAIEQFVFLQNYLAEPDADLALKNLRAKIGPEFSSHADDEPFVYNIWRSPRFNSGEFWRQQSLSLLNWQWSDPVTSAAVLGAFAVLLVVLTSSLFGGIKGTVFFTGIGFFSTALQILAVYKFLLYLSNPTLAVLLAVGGLLSASAVGSWTAAGERRLPRWGTAAIGLAGAAIWCWSWRWPLLVHSYFTLPELLRAACLSVPILLPAGIASSIYVRKLQAQASDHGPRAASRALALDSSGAALAMLWIPLLVESCGFQTTATLLIAVLTAALLAA